MKITQYSNTQFSNKVIILQNPLKKNQQKSNKPYQKFYLADEWKLKKCLFDKFFFLNYLFINKLIMKGDSNFISSDFSKQRDE